MSAPVGARRVSGLLLAAMTALIVMTPVPASAEVTTADVSVPVAQVSPYQPPDVTGINGLPGLDLFTPFENLPLWAQAAIVSALVTAAFFTLTAIVRWVWRVVSDLRSRTI